MVISLDDGRREAIEWYSEFNEGDFRKQLGRYGRIDPIREPSEASCVRGALETPLRYLRALRNMSQQDLSSIFPGRKVDIHLINGLFLDAKQVYDMLRPSEKKKRGGQSIPGVL